jgi:hypothetical protein
VKLPRLPWWGWALVAALPFSLVTGGAVVAVKAVLAARGRREVFNQVRDEVARQLAELRPDLSPAQVLRAAEVLAALAVFETGGGVTVAWRQGWNFGNVTAGSAWGRAVIVGPDTEYDAAGNVKNIAQKFRKYDSLAQAVEDFLPGGSIGALDWAREKREGAWERLLAGDAAGFTAALSRAGYYTLPEPEYTAGVSSVLTKYGRPA